MARIAYPCDKLLYATALRWIERDWRATALSLDGGDRILVLSPHHDDEVLGCGGALMEARTSARIQVVYVNDGGGRPELRSPALQEAVVAIRMREARQVCNRLGIEAPIFLNMTHSEAFNPARVAETLRALIEAWRPQVVLAPCLTDGHPHHIATTQALLSLADVLERDVRTVLYQVHSQIPPNLTNRYLALTPAEHRQKETLLQLYESQAFNDQSVLRKHTLLSRQVPAGVKERRIQSIERFYDTDMAGLRALDQRIDYEKLLPKLKSINYAPLSFRNYMRNLNAYRRYIVESAVGS